MICKYRVTLEGIKGFFRVYEIGSEHSLYRFHKQLRADMEFPMDQPILFKAFDAEGNVIARYALIDLGFGTVDNVTIDQAIRAGAVKFTYFYDIASKKSVTITLEGQGSGSGKIPTIIESKGPNPIEFENGYVAFEDLPEQHRRLPSEASEEDDDDDNEDDEDEESEDKEEEELIYSEDED